MNAKRLTIPKLQNLIYKLDKEIQLRERKAHMLINKDRQEHDKETDKIKNEMKELQEALRCKKLSDYKPGSLF